MKIIHDRVKCVGYAVAHSEEDAAYARYLVASPADGDMPLCVDCVRDCLASIHRCPHCYDDGRGNVDADVHVLCDDGTTYWLCQPCLLNERWLEYSESVKETDPRSPLIAVYVWTKEDQRRAEWAMRNQVDEQAVIDEARARGLL